MWAYIVICWQSCCENSCPGLDRRCI